MEKIILKTKDGSDISADYYNSPNSDKAAILVHMMHATKETWRNFASRLVAKGYSALAIDLRGHGESSKGPLGYRLFSDAEHQAGIHDIEAAVAFLERNGVKREAIACIGASIGANLCLLYITERPETKQAVLLSPGLNYRGIETEPLMAKAGPGQRIMLVGSKDDPQSNGDVMQALAERAPEEVNTNVLIYKAAGHGTNMFGKEIPDLAEEILNWLKDNREYATLK